MEVVEVEPEATYDLRRRVLRSHDPSLPVANAEDVVPGAFHLAVVSAAGAVVAVASCSPTGGGDVVRLRGMAVEPALQRSGVGSLLLRAALDRLSRDDGIRMVWANARVTALGFYERHGFVAVGDVFDSVGIPHVRVERPVGPDVQSADA